MDTYRKKSFIQRLGRAAVVLLLCTTSSLALEPDQGEFDWGFIASSFRDVNGDLRFRVGGPFFEKSTATNGNTFLASRPFYSRAYDRSAERAIQEVLWPIASAKRFRGEFSWRFLTAISLDYDVDDPLSRYRFWVLPLYYQGRDKRGVEYLAVFPLGGTIREFIRQDEIVFVFFPLLAWNSINAVETRHVFWPIYARTQGKRTSRLRVFPFYGKATHRDQFSKNFVMWPIWTAGIYTYPQSHGKGYILFPFWGHIDLNDEQTWMFLPPLFKIGRGDRLNAVHAPWPFIQYYKGETEKLYLFPIWGRKALAGSDSGFLLWPIFRRERFDKGDTVFSRHLALPFLYVEVSRERTHNFDVAPTVQSRYMKLWPLCSYYQDADASRFRMLELWPNKYTGPIERNFAPFWTLYTRSCINGSMKAELLWGLYRHHVEKDRKRYLSVFPFFSYRAEVGEREIRSYSILKGLIEYHRRGRQKQFRLFYGIRWSAKEKRE